MSDRIYRYLGPSTVLTVSADGVDQNFLRFISVPWLSDEDDPNSPQLVDVNGELVFHETNLGFRADTPAIAAMIEGEYAPYFTWEGKE